MKISIIDKKPSCADYSKYFDFDFDVYHLTDDPDVEKVLKAKITLDYAPIVESSDLVILVGAAPAKFVAKITGIVAKQGHLFDKFIPLTSPNVIDIRPEAEAPFMRAATSINSIVTGNVVDQEPFEMYYLDSEDKITEYLDSIKDAAFICMDTETTGLKARKCQLLNISITTKENSGAFLDADYITEQHCEVLQDMFYSKPVVFHRAKFDMQILNYHLDLDVYSDKVYQIHDTQIMHYILDESKGTHGLKDLALKYTKFGDYDAELEDFKRSFCKSHGIKIGDFSYGYIPKDILAPYACKDTAVTFDLFKFFLPKIDKHFSNLYYNLMMPASSALAIIEDTGIPIDKTIAETIYHALNKEKQLLQDNINQQVKEYGLTSINLNSPQQVVKLFYTHMGLTPIEKRTDAGNYSVDEEVLTTIADMGYDIAKDIVEFKKISKLTSTYISKFISRTDSDSRYRVEFNLTTTTSGRLSSSAQQFPRDRKEPKRCISARPGYKIVNIDLTTAEMYCAAALSGDVALQNVFRSKQDFHSTIGKEAYNLTCDVREVKKLFPQARQGSKALSFGILYGSGPDKVANTAEISLREAKALIKWYFDKFPSLKTWLDDNKEDIKRKGYCKSAMGRKRRLKNIRSTSKSVVGHEVRSGINFLVQSVASDIILYATIDLIKHIRNNKLPANVIMLVHDSIVAEVKEDHLDEYINYATKFIQKDRGVFIKDCPITVDVEMGSSYAFE